MSGSGASAARLMAAALSGSPEKAREDWLCAIFQDMVVLGYLYNSGRIAPWECTLGTECLYFGVLPATCVLGENLSRPAIAERLVESSVVVEANVALNSPA
jgi:hypothetical protein